MADTLSPRPVRLVAREPLARDVLLLRFVPADGGPPEPAAAGAHVDLHLPGGLVRPYSLLLDGRGDRRGYEIAVRKDPRGRGGSRAVHESLAIGTVLPMGRPRNAFPLVEHAAHSVLVAGGIGITPLWSMLRRLEVLGRSFELHYACRSRPDAVFHGALAGRRGVSLHVADERPGRMDVAAICRAAPRDAHLYGCGPASLIEAFEHATRDRPPGQVHVERFAAPALDVPADAHDFELALARSGRLLTVRAGERIVDVLRQAGLAVSVSCEQGMCGACETRVIAGVPAHRCQVLSAEERAANRTMMICCSGSRDARLVLDL